MGIEEPKCVLQAVVGHAVSQTIPGSYKIKQHIFNEGMDCWLPVDNFEGSHLESICDPDILFIGTLDDFLYMASHTKKWDDILPRMEQSRYLTYFCRNLHQVYYYNGWVALIIVPTLSHNGSTLPSWYIYKSSMGGTYALDSCGKLYVSITAANLGAPTWAAVSGYTLGTPAPKKGQTVTLTRGNHTDVLPHKVHATMKGRTQEAVAAVMAALEKKFHVTLNAMKEKDLGIMDYDEHFESVCNVIDKMHTLSHYE